MGTHPIKYFMLNKNELTYEVLIRGEEPAPNVLGLRKQITKLTSLIPNDDICESGIETSVDCEGVLPSLSELATRISTLNAKFDGALFERSKALHNHIYHRLRRMDGSDTVLAKKVASLNTEFSALSKKLTAFQKQDNTHCATPERTCYPQSSVSIEGSSIVSVQCEHTQTGELTRLKYDGKSCVHAFVQKINECRLARNIPPNRLLMYAPEIFTGNALHWYRSVRDTVNSWDELVMQLVEDFSPFDYDYRLMSEIRNRTQGESENIVIYLSIMSQFFSRLTKPISEQEKLDILLHNIRPCYSTVLASCVSGVGSIASLRKLCLSYEKFQCLTSQFHEPPRVSNATLAPDLAYNKAEPKPNFYKNNYYLNKSYSSNQSHSNPYNQRNDNPYNPNNKTTSVPVAAVDSKTESSAGRQPFCPRCRSNEHSLRECKQERFPICFKCGRRDVIYKNCPVCQSGPNQKN